MFVTYFNNFYTCLLCVSMFVVCMNYLHTYMSCAWTVCMYVCRVHKLFGFNAFVVCLNYLKAWSLCSWEVQIHMCCVQELFVYMLIVCMKYWYTNLLRSSFFCMHRLLTAWTTRIYGFCIHELFVSCCCKCKVCIDLLCVSLFINMCAWTVCRHVHRVRGLFAYVFIVCLN